mgnify:CR=1 FL=1
MDGLIRSSLWVQGQTPMHATLFLQCLAQGTLQTVSKVCVHCLLINQTECHSFDWLCCYYVFLVVTGSQIMVPSTLMDEAMLLPCAYPSGIAKQFPQRQPGNDNIYHQSLLESSTRVAAELLAISACIKSAELKK